MDLLKQATQSLMTRYAILHDFALGAISTHIHGERDCTVSQNSCQADWIIATLSAQIAFPTYLRTVLHCSATLRFLHSESVSSCLAHAFNVKVDEGSRL
jgi:hypothetical protein